MVLFGQLGCQGPRYTIKKYILTENASGNHNSVIKQNELRYISVHLWRQKYILNNTMKA